MEGEPERDKLHATTDFQQVRNEVFEALSAETFRVDATILDKPKSQPSIRETDHMFYQYAWYYHFKHFAARARQGADKFLITAAALGEKKTRAAFKAAVNNPIQQVLSRDRWEVAFHESCKDPLLWVADYCAWAIQRKWEMQDTRSYDIIKTKIATEFDLFKHGTTEYY